MSEWKEERLGPLVKLSQGQVINSKTNYLVVAEGLPLLRITDMLNKTKSVFIDKNRVPKKNIAIPEDIIFTRTGQVGLVFRNQYGVVHNNCFKVLPIDKKLECDYLYWYLRSNAVYNYVNCIASGSAQPDLPHSSFNSITIKLPSNKVQNKIASILSAYDDLIENNNRRIALLEQMAEQIYKEWFVRMRFPGYENMEFEKGVPKGWEVTCYSELVEFKKGRNITADTVIQGSVPVVAGGLEPAYYHNTANTNSPTITISASGANAGYVNLYYDNIWASDCSFLDSKTTKCIFYHYLHLKTRQTEVYFLQKGSAQPHVYPKDLMSMKILNPQIDLIEKFDDLITPFFKEIKTLKTQIQTLKQTRDLLLPRLISGKLKVNEIKEFELE